MNFIYVGDPLCSWCYGFGPAVDQMLEKYPQFPLRVIMGGLRPSTTHAMDESMKEMLRGHWKHVEEATGQPFNYDLLEADSAPFVYNTEPPCRAVATVRALKPGAEWSFFKDVQTAFYAENKDTHQVETYLPLLEPHGIDPKEFTTHFTTEEARKDTHDDFMWTKQVGITGFPTLLFGEGSELFGVSMGYSPFEVMDGVMKSILADQTTEK